MNKYIIIFTTLFLVSCGGMPKHADLRSDDQPTIYIDKSGIGSEIYIDGTLVGIVSKKQQAFNVSPGKHEIKIMSPSGKVTIKKIFIEGNTQRKISLN